MTSRSLYHSAHTASYSFCRLVKSVNRLEGRRVIFYCTIPSTPETLGTCGCCMQRLPNGKCVSKSKAWRVHSLNTNGSVDPSLHRLLSPTTYVSLRVRFCGQPCREHIFGCEMWWVCYLLHQLARETREQLHTVVVSPAEPFSDGGISDLGKLSIEFSGWASVVRAIRLLRWLVQVGKTL